VGLWNLLDEHPLEPSDVDVVRTVAEGVIGFQSVFVQAMVRPGDTFVGSLRVIDLEVQREDRDDRAKRMQAALREAGYEAHVRLSGRAIWPDVEVSRLRTSEWKRRHGKGT
jgi:hypothetical protein